MTFALTCLRSGFILFLSFLVLAVSAQSDNTVAIGERISINSEVLGEERFLWIHTPMGMAENSEIPVVYLLDGSAHFQSVSALVDYMAGNDLCPPMIVVGIENTDRSRDLSPTKADTTHPYSAGGRFATAGGGPAFMKFIETELFPYIESNYPTAPYRMFIGHSLGGLTTMDALLHYTDLFDAFISIDPSMWWSDQSLLKELEAQNKKGMYKGKSMYLGIANTLSRGTSIESAKADTSMDSGHIRAIIATDEFFKAHPENDLKYGSKYYPQEDHGSVPLITEYDAFRFIFDFYRFYPSEFNDSTLENFIVHNKVVSKNMGYDVTPSEVMINGMGYGYLQEEKFELAETAFLLNVKNYPKSGNVYDSLGDYYSAVGKNEKAIESFQKALDIEEAAHTREKLESLKNPE
ncbi:alpha/beta hydrolase-fold protein [Cryomorphaceae bacterium 1068]|nr:alpha/beta hydrolase-fold protein [Cryomorphaceae bacterium 1068]